MLNLSFSICTKTMSKTINCNLKTYRYTFSQEFTDELSIFAKIHQYDERTQFKEAWQLWIVDDTYAPLIKTETDRLLQLGYDGDVMKKMFHSARFYYRKKSSSGKTNEPTDELQNIDAEELDTATHDTPKMKHRFGKDFLKQIDTFILESILSKNHEKSDEKIELSPADSYDAFKEQYQTLIDDEFKSITENKNLEDIVAKLKKTYKNRFYNIKSKYNLLKI